MTHQAWGAIAVAQSDRQLNLEQANKRRKFDDRVHRDRAGVLEWIANGRRVQVGSPGVQFCLHNLRDATIAKQTEDIQALTHKLAGIRIDPKNAVVQQADGHITRLPGNGVLYIDLGAGDQVSPGLTFEVYDKRKGVPAVGDGTREGELPVGKASIEVVRVGQGSSECRIVKQELGQTLVEGDLIANVVFDPKTKYKFLVYGNFDMDQNGIASSEDAKIIQRLITQWGGQLTDKVDVETDFVVLGKEPEVPVLSEEDKNNPVEEKKVADAQAALEAYQKVLKSARDLTIPVMNQNRFLYFVGYFDQVKR